jgi:hypothetical protein
VLFDAAEAIRLAAVLLEPIMPTSCREILRRVGTTAEGLTFDRDGRWRNDGERVLAQDGPLCRAWGKGDDDRDRQRTSRQGAASAAPGTQHRHRSTCTEHLAPQHLAPPHLHPAPAGRIASPSTTS